MEFLIMVGFVFLLCMCIGSVLNILLRMTSKINWLITVFISLSVAIFAQILNIM
ncbi:hypothetical protein [Bacillus salacetis]|uniref:hypothetical protein n=1 Tax=Bacillus salacetis TaxID=2315464 RepID=UPI0014446759|nr:hypothetical protein [Bacillus salacetis]